MMMTAAMMVAMFFAFFTTVTSLVRIRFVNHLTDNRTTGTAYPCTDHGASRGAADFTANHGTRCAASGTAQNGPCTTSAASCRCPTQATAYGTANHLTRTATEYATNRSASSCAYAATETGFQIICHRCRR
jgi:hypothetical protein